MTNDIPDFCEKCNSGDFVIVINSRATVEGRVRRYKCTVCDERWSTNERRQSFSDVTTPKVCKNIAAKAAQLVALCQEVKELADRVQPRS